MSPLLGITMGDPSGVGPELLLKYFASSTNQKKAQFVIFGDFTYLMNVHRGLQGKRISWPFRFIPISPNLMPLIRRKGFSGSGIPILDYGLLANRKPVFGKVSGWSGKASRLYIEKAAEAATRGFIDGLVTMPINKESFSLGAVHKGTPKDHTQLLAALTKSPHVALMLASKNVRAIHVTQHVPLKSVASLITKARVWKTIELAYHGLRLMGISNPRLAVCGLNPHAGDGGVLGNEEEKIIRPMVNLGRSKGWRVTGPLSADVVWPLVKSGKFDAGIAMYHDQGQIPVKLMGADVVNITLGLPIIRTSVGHGTAFDIAGQGIASIVSFQNAVDYALKMIQRN